MARSQSGPVQIFVQSFPDPSKGKWQISTAGGISPKWRRDGRELFYLDSMGRLVAVQVKTDGNFEVGKAEVLFQVIPGAPVNPAGSARIFDVAADGQRFIASVPLNVLNNATPNPLKVIVNWTSALPPS